MKISDQAQAITPFLVMDVMERANMMSAGGAEIIHLEVGEPDFDTPRCIRDAARAAMEEGKTHYTDSRGIPELRDAICSHYKNTYGVEVDRNQVLVTGGSSPALLIAIACLAAATDEIIMPDPYYACYPNFVRVVGATPKLIPTGSDDGFQLDPEKVRKAIGSSTKAMLINSPANPTGVCLDTSHLGGLASTGLPIISDEIYHGLVYESQQHTILEYTDNAIVINGFSKAYAMTGWRLGWAVFPRSLARTAQKIQQNLMICAPSVAQWGGVAALTRAHDDVAHMHKIFSRRRKVMLDTMAEHGFVVEAEPTGAFYVLVNMKDISSDSYCLAMDILDHTGVGVTPGIDFGPGAATYLRFSYANAEENIRKGVKKVADYIGTL
ncbi:MAG TPA: pyridoxal phosphate-dependent aminotransferase [Deltaproteobacteria bacterium]|nr:pyridoxal phosphate-dependent aminotransferase [Deltaproteobacteria bacterium]